MIEILRSNDRGHANHGWLDSYHTFSFADYHNPDFMGFSDLRVINEDWIDAAGGFGTHAHSDMEIITYVLEGQLEHKDSMGNGSVIRPGDVQRMTAGTGITHSEKNPSTTEKCHLLQIWILPEKRGLKPGYEQKRFEPDEKKNRLRLIASHDGEDGSVTVHQDVSLYASILEEGKALEWIVDEERSAWIHVISGRIKVGDETLSAGDAMSVTDSESLEITALQNSEFLLFDLTEL
jgi:quercetin 2,3-dioxygenase